MSNFRTVNLESNGEYETYSSISQKNLHNFEYFTLYV